MADAPGKKLPEPLGQLSLERAAKAAAVVGLLLYAVGLIAVNGYLSLFGFTDLSELKTRFVFTGALVIASICIILLLLLIAVAIPVLVGREVEDMLKSLDRALRRSRRRWLTGLVNGVLKSYVFSARRILWVYSLLIPWVVLRVFLTVAGDVDSARDVDPGLNALELYGASAGLGAASWAVAFYGFGKMPPPAWLNVLTKLRERWAVLMVVISVGLTAGLFVYVPVLYGRYVYPLVPERFGGGRPLYVQLGFAPDDLETAESVGVDLLGDNGQMSHPVCLVYKGDDSYLIALEPGIAIRLNADVVVAVRSSLRGCARMW
jgi:hypothetical protein